MQIEVMREKRRTLVLRIAPNGSVVLKVPLKFSDHKVDEFLYSKRKWISNKIAFMKEQQSRAEAQPNVDYDTSFEEVVLPLVKEIGERYNLSCMSVESIHSKKRWGSFDLKGKMKLNYKISALPKELIEYIIIHEYCHALEMNHSVKFWECVGKYDKDFKEHRKQLKQHAYLLVNKS